MGGFGSGETYLKRRVQVALLPPRTVSTSKNTSKSLSVIFGYRYKTFLFSLQNMALRDDWPSQLESSSSESSTPPVNLNTSSTCTALGPRPELNIDKGSHFLLLHDDILTLILLELSLIAPACLAHEAHMFDYERFRYNSWSSPTAKRVSRLG